MYMQRAIFLCFALDINCDANNPTGIIPILFINVYLKLVIPIGTVILFKPIIKYQYPLSYNFRHAASFYAFVLQLQGVQKL